ncbi:hypothetical protein C2G38_2082876 [Gigaspora rosea]|uniref:Uncharacterized protein n=1 Tax=Gigaspora rosea TaxID=44941 RepID=A0A397VI64_9GLOM|nr:hypothetical protein C2G38_2082876 [Gigaspora rosea]
MQFYRPLWPQRRSSSSLINRYELDFSQVLAELLKDSKVVSKFINSYADMKVALIEKKEREKLDLMEKKEREKSDLTDSVTGQNYTGQNYHVSRTYRQCFDEADSRCKVYIIFKANMLT